MTITAPYGSWESSLDVSALTAGTTGLGGGTIDDGRIYWTESHPDQGGRTSLWRQDPDGTRHELTPDRDVRDMVHEYGGGAWTVRDGIVVFSTHPSHRCYVLRDGVISPLTPDGGTLRYADFEILPESNLVLAVREDHRDGDLDCRNELVALRLDSDNPDGGRVLRSGADFYSSPRLAPDGRLAWVEWDHPNMPWDHTRLMVASLSEHPCSLTGARQVSSGATAACHPAWRGRDLVFLDDPTGFWNFQSWSGHDVVALHDDEHDYCYPAWVFGGAYCLLADGRIACLRCEDGREQFGYLDADGVFTPDARPTSDVGIGGDGERIVLLASWPDRAPTLELIDPAGGDPTELRRGFDLPLDPDSVSCAESQSWESPQGPVQAWFYPPRHTAYVAPEGELPPLRVLVHGGPTGMTTNALRLSVQFWTTRGFAVLDVNYGGSAGFGRSYRERLRGQWGVVEVRDCCEGAAQMAARGLVDPNRLAIEGGSAGGYTTLAALTTSDTFSAGNCLYGIADLTVFAKETHKFESRYLVGLMGGTPEDVPEIYRDRSPLTHLQHLSCPLLIQQGEDDRIVPPNQARLMFDAARDRGLPTALLMFPGEGHGWRRAETIKASTEAALSFYGQVFGFTPPGVARLTLENLR